MKKPMEKTLVILLITLLIASSTLVLQAYAQDVPTEAFLDATPNPVQVGTSLTITAWITPPPPEGETFHDVDLTITNPDGSDQDVIFNTDTDGYFIYVFIPDMVGDWEFQLHYPGEVFEVGGTYLPSDSSLLVVQVQEEPIPPEYVLEITVNPLEGGNVTKDPDLETYPLGTQVTLEAFANEGYTFAGWSGDLTGTTNPQTLVIDENPQVTAYFSLDYIPPGENVTVYPHPNVTLTFDEVLTGGEVHVTTSYDGPPGYPLDGIGPYYYIEANPLTFTTVTIGIHYDDTGLTPEQETGLTLWRFDPAVPVTGDVDGNGRVGWIDLFLVAWSLGSRPGRWRWNPACDLNGDNRVNWVDLCIVLMNFGKTSTPATWTNITANVDVVNNIVYGDTDHFSPYRVH